MHLQLDIILELPRGQQPTRPLYLSVNPPITCSSSTENIPSVWMEFGLYNHSTTTHHTAVLCSGGVCVLLHLIDVSVLI